MTPRKGTIAGLIEEMLAFGVRLETAQYAAPILLRAINERRLEEVLWILEQGPARVQAWSTRRKAIAASKDVAFQRFKRGLLH